MMPAKNETALKVLTYTVGLILLGLFAEAFFPSQMERGLLLARLMHLCMALLLVIVLILLGLISKKSRKLELAAHSQEITEMQREVDRTVLRYKSLLEGAGNAIFVFNAETGILEEVNRKGTELLGYSKEEMAALRGKDLVQEEDQEKFTSLVLRVRRRGRFRLEGITFKRKSGDRFQGEIEARLIDLGDEKVVHAIVRDMTSKRRAEREIRQRNRELSILNNFIARANESLELQTVLDVTLRETIEVFGVEGGVIHLLEPERECLALAATHEISPLLRPEIENCSLGSENPCRIVTTQHCHTVEDFAGTPCTIGQLAAADGWRSSAAAPLLAKNRLIGIMHIMTRKEHRFTSEEMNLFTAICTQIGIVIEHARLFEELNWKNEELLRSHRLLEKSSHQLSLSQNRLKKNLALVERANLELERLDRMKNNFLGMISHEFKTPLTGIMSSAEFLLDTLENLNDEESRLLDMILKGGARLNEIVTDLLKVARLEAATFPVTKTALRLADILDPLQEQFEPLLNERNQQIVFDNLDALPYFSGDREYLEEVFFRLLENAIKFSRDGGEIVVSARVSDSKTLAGKREILFRFNSAFYDQMGDTCYLEVEVRDSGVGIDADEQLKIFEKFYEVGEIRHHSSGRHKFLGKGTGLGLTIVKGMVEAHGGMVWVESPAQSTGSSFFVLLPLEENLRQPAFPFMQGEHAPASPETLQ
ncbi:MAG: multi-sensor signal transduction histidine [Geobacteraceae bacterium]|nr:MAG: multi-sensor signal transduction histidine [Geobacteraceae bacterium]